MRISTLYGVIIRFNDGGQQMKSFSIKNSAINEAKKIINLIKSSAKKGFEVYLSELEYDEYKNLILSDSLINNESELLFSN